MDLAAWSQVPDSRTNSPASLTYLSNPYSGMVHSGPVPPPSRRTVHAARRPRLFPPRPHSGSAHPLAVAAVPGLRQSFALLDGDLGAGKALWTADLAAQLPRGGTAIRSGLARRPALTRARPTDPRRAVSALRPWLASVLTRG